MPQRILNYHFMVTINIIMNQKKSQRLELPG